MSNEQYFKKILFIQNLQKYGENDDIHDFEPSFIEKPGFYIKILELKLKFCKNTQYTKKTRKIVNFLLRNSIFNDNQEDNNVNIKKLSNLFLIFILLETKPQQFLSSIEIFYQPNSVIF